jgi:O-antigen/teichoic acid export membrane protein
MLPVAGFLLVAAEPLVVLLYGERYLGAVAPFRIYTALLPLRVTAYGIMLMAFGRTAAILKVHLIGLGLNFALSVALMSEIGMLGAPVAAVISQVSMMAILLASTARIADCPIGDAFPWRHYARVAALATLAAVPVGIGLRSVGHRLPGLVVVLAGAALYLASYLGLVSAAGLLTQEDRRFIARWARLEPLRSGPA